MIPIYEQGDGHGVGHNINTFIRRFDEICLTHIRQKRAKSFAFIFYDFTNNNIRRVLKNEGVFAHLDRLSGTDISIFYLHIGSKDAIQKFNQHFAQELGLGNNLHLPSVVFFDISETGVSDITAIELQNENIIHAFHELYTIIQDRINKIETPSGRQKYTKIFKSCTQFIALETVSGLLQKCLGLLF